MPFESFSHVPVTEEILRHVWEGEPNERKGGHRFGLGREGKTEFPEHWNLSMVEQAITETLKRPQAVRINKDSTSCLRQVGRVVMIVRLYSRHHRLNILTAYPLSGDGVGQNRQQIRVDVPLDLSVLEA